MRRYQRDVAPLVAQRGDVLDARTFSLGNFMWACGVVMSRNWHGPWPSPAPRARCGEKFTRHIGRQGSEFGRDREIDFGWKISVEEVGV
jgi:hypothetical protein